MARNLRYKQKARTRRAIVEAALRKRAPGVPLILEEVAEEAEVSRATIYRYFPSASALEVELGLAVQLKDLDTLFAKAGQDPLARLLCVHNHLFDLVADNESQFRSYLQSTLDQWQRQNGSPALPLRGSRRIALVEAALEPLRDGMDPAVFERRVQMFCLLISLEPFLVLRDACQLEIEEARERMAEAIRIQFAGAFPEVVRG